MVTEKNDSKSKRETEVNCWENRASRSWTRVPISLKVGETQTTKPNKCQRSFKTNPSERQWRLCPCWHTENIYSQVIMLGMLGLFLPVVHMKPSDCFAAPKHGWLGRPARLMRLEQFPFDLRLPLSCQFTPFLRFYPRPPAATFTSPHILHCHHSHNSSKIKSQRQAKRVETGLITQVNAGSL